MRGLWAKASAASVPAEMVQLIIAAGKIHLPDELAIFRGTRIEVNYTHGVALSILPDVEQRDVSETLWGGLHGHTWRRVESWVRHQGHSQSPLAEYPPKDLDRRGG